jgi:hypothetical protein
MTISKIDAPGSLKALLLGITASDAITIWAGGFRGTLALFVKGIEQALAAPHSADRLSMNNRGLLAPDAAPMRLVFPVA